MRLVWFFLSNSQHLAHLPTTFIKFDRRKQKKLCTHIFQVEHLPLNYCTAAVVVSTGIPMRLTQQQWKARACTATCTIPSDVIGVFFLSNSQHSAEVILPNNLHSIPPAKTESMPRYKKIIKKKHQQCDHRDMQRSGTKNGAIRREGACSRPAKRQGQGKAATEKGRIDGGSR